MIVQVEGARTNASLATICQLADALGAPVQSLIELPHEGRFEVVRAEDMPVLWSTEDGSWARLLCGTASREKLELYARLGLLGTGADGAFQLVPEADPKALAGGKRGGQ